MSQTIETIYYLWENGDKPCKFTISFPGDVRFETHEYLDAVTELVGQNELTERFNRSGHRRVGLYRSVKDAVPFLRAHVVYAKSAGYFLSQLHDHPDRDPEESP